MMTSDSRICRLCFDDIEENHVQILNKNIQGMLQTLLINIDISSSEPSGICATCYEKLEKYYYFKKKCMFTEEALGPLKTKNVKINLNEIFTLSHKSEDVDRDKNVCRLCLQYSDDDMILHKHEKKKFRSLFPEINLNLTNFVVLCSTCYNKLQKYFLFVSLCSRNQDLLHKFPVDCYSKQSSGNNLQNRPKFSRSAEVADEKNVVLLNEEVPIKREEELLCDISINCSTEQIIGIKLEETRSLSINTDVTEDDKKLILLHEELNIKSDGDSSEKEFIYSHSGKKEYNFKMEPNKVEIEKRGLSFKDMEESIGNTTGLKTFAEDVCKNQQENIILNAHIGSSKTDMHKCDQCDYESSRLRYLKNHILREHTDPSKIQMYECEQCEYKAKRKRNLRKHIKLRHTDPSERIKYKCDKCGYKGKSQKDLKRHVFARHSVPSKIKMYQCEKCDFKTKHKRYLETHTVHQHADPSESKKYKCDKCGYKCKTREYLKYHLHKVHIDSSKIQMYECKECDFKAKYTRHLECHILFCHTDSSISKKYKCGKCGYKGKSQKNLKCHVFAKHSESLQN